MHLHFDFKALRARLAVWRGGKSYMTNFAQLLFLGSLSILYLQRLTIRNHLFPQHHTQPPSAPPIIAYYNADNVLQACSLPNVCIKMHHSDRELHLPSIYRSQHALVRRCHTYMTQPYFPKNLPFKLHFYDPANTTLPTAQQHPVDVLGAPFHNKFYAHFAHFAPDFAESVMVPVSLFATNNNNYSLTAKCTAPDGTTTPCEVRPTDPRVVISAYNARNGTWTDNFLRFIGSTTRQPLLYHARPVNPATRTCFRSLVTNAVVYDVDRPERDALLRRTGVARGPARPRCAPHIVVLSRKPDAARAIPFKLLAELRVALQDELGRASPNATLEFVQDLRHLGFGGQVALLQRADVLVAAHGAELSNALFLRRGATVFEIYPFGWVLRNCFQRVLAAVHARRVELLSPPDPARFRSCMRPHGRRGELAVYEKHVSMYYEARDEEQRFRAAPRFWELSRETGGCLAYQATTFDPVQLARRIVRESKQRCET